MSASTIFARASGAGRAGVAVFRISGPLASSTLARLTGKLGQPRVARRAPVRGRDGELIDDGLALWFPAPKSFTGEDVVELHLHGSPAVEQRLTDELTAFGLEPAGPGAFTMRAFANGKLDLTQAEGLADLLDAETALQHRQAMAQYSGKLREKADQWRAELIRAMARLDAAVDFPDEEDVPGEIAADAAPYVSAILESIEAILEEGVLARRITEGVTIALVGPPNAGKSTLFNALLKEERAIVSAEAGTTRDIVSAVLDWAGHRVTLMDMAGIREIGGSAIEDEGIRRAQSAAEAADLRILCWPAGAGSRPSWMDTLYRPGDVALTTKTDLTPAISSQSGTSVHDPGSIAALSTQIGEKLDGLAAPGLAPSDRQRHLLASAAEELRRFGSATEFAPEIAAETLRGAARRLEELTGRIAPDDVLGDIFSAFCIGK